MESCLEVVHKRSKGEGVIATRSIPAEEVLLTFEQHFIDHPTNKTLRIDAHTHQVSTNPEAPENFINHACEPNAYIDFKDLVLRALRPIMEGEEVTYNYFTSDWDSEDVFECRCGSPVCKGHIAGFRYLSLQERLKIQEFVSPFIKERLFA